MKGKITAVLFIVVFLLVVAVVCTFLTSWNKEPEATEPPESSTIIVDVPPEASAPVQTQEPQVVLPSTQPQSTPQATPVPTQSPEPSPSPEPAFTPSSLGSGSFASETGAKIDLKADWSARTISESQVEISVTVSLDSYAIHLNAVPDSVKVNLGGQYVSLDAPAIDYDGNPAINTVLASKTFTVELAQGQSESYNLNVEWHFGGTYGDVELPVIECGGTISLSR